MATIQNNPSNTPKFTPGPSKPKRNMTPILGGLAVVLLLALIALGVSYANRGSENAELQTSLEEMEQFKVQAEKQYYESLAELEEMRGSNEELNALIDQQKDQLRTQKDKITALTRDSRNLSAARRELADLRSKTEGYLIQIEEQKQAIALLEEDNSRLNSEKELLSTDLQSSRQQNESLTNERAVLLDKQEELSSQNQELSRKVNVASVIKVNNVSVVGQKERRSGKWVDRRNAKNVQRLHVCFNSLDNAVARVGEEVFQLRIINPGGETIQIDAEGSGILTEANTGDKIPYTREVAFAFDGSAGSHCSDWSVPSQKYSEGTYTVELYNKGFLVGNGEVSLR